MVGFDLFSLASDEIVVWDENAAAFDLFARLRTQWNVGMSGPTGLRYEALYPLLNRVAKTDAEWDELFSDVQTMEAAALNQINEDNDRNANNHK